MPRKATHVINWTNAALQDVLSIVEYVALESPETATTLSRRIDTAVVSLRRSPNRGRVVPELGLLGRTDHREIILRPWRIIYRIRGKGIWIVAVLDGRRNVREVLAKRFGR